MDRDVRAAEDRRHEVGVPSSAALHQLRQPLPFAHLPAAVLADHHSPSAASPVPRMTYHHPPWNQAPRWRSLIYGEQGSKPASAVIDRDVKISHHGSSGSSARHPYKFDP